MAFKTLLAVCLLAVVVEGYIGGAFPNMAGFGLVPALPLPPLPPLPGGHRLTLPTPPPLLVPVFGNQGFNYPTPPPFNFPKFPTAADVANAKPPRDGSYHGMSTSTVNGVTVFMTNDNGKTQTFIRPSPDSGFSEVPQRSGMASLIEVRDKLMQDIFNMPFGMPPMPTFPKPIDVKSGPSENGNFQIVSLSSSSSYSSKDGEEPSYVSNIHTIVNKDGQIKEDLYHVTNKK